MARIMAVGGRRPLTVATAALLAVGALMLVGGPAHGEFVAPGQPGAQFSAYGAGTTLHVNAVQTADVGPKIANAGVAFSGASTNTAGLGTAVNDELGEPVQPVKAGLESYGRGDGVEVGLGTAVPNNPDANQIILGDLAEAAASPPEPTADPAPAGPYQTGVVEKTLLDVPADPLAYASTLRGDAQALYNEKALMPMLGTPMAFGLGYAEDAQLVNTGAANTDGTMQAPLVEAYTDGPGRSVSQSASYTYLVNNGDGKCGVGVETRQTIAPVTLFGGTDNAVTIEVLGEWVLRMVATGTGDPVLTYGPGTVSPETPILRILQGGTVNQILKFQDLFGDTGLTIPGAPLLEVAIGEDPRGIAAPTASPDPESQPTKTSTDVAAAVDVARIRLLPTAAPMAGFTALDLRIGHFEGKIHVPAGGVNCEIPIQKKPDKDPATIGQPLTYTVTVPLADIMAPFPCELTNIKVTDTTGPDPDDKTINKSNPPKFNISGGSVVGNANAKPSVSADKQSITFDNIGTWKPGDPPIQVKITGSVAGGPGKIKDTATATATPGNCKAVDSVVGRVIGNVVGGSDLAGNFFGRSGLTGSFTGQGPAKALSGSGVQRTAAGVPLVVTGGSTKPWMLAAAALAILGAAGVGYMRRRVPHMNA
jgi:hypothetical protein